MRKIISIVLCCTVMMGVFTACNSKSKTDNQPTETAVVKVEAPDKKYVKMAKEVNEKMPMVLPGGIRLDKTEAVSKHEFKYYYTFTKEPEVSAEEFIRSSKPALSLGAKESKEDIFETFKKDKMTLTFAYYKMDGSLFAEVILKPEDYK